MGSKTIRAGGAVKWLSTFFPGEFLLALLTQPLAVARAALFANPP